MPKLNPYLIENKAQVEEVREIENQELITPEERAKIVDKLVKNEIPSYEEFMKTYEEDKEAIDNYYYEIDSHGDISVFKCYGPGFWDELGEGVKEVGKFGIKWGGSALIGAGVVATGPFAIPLGAAVATEGYLLKKAGEQSDNDVVEFLGDTVMGGGIGGVSGGLIGTGSSSVASKASRSAFETGVRTAGTNGSKVLLRAWIYTKAAQEGYDLCSKSKSAAEGFCHYFHGKHKAEGISYKSDCPVCNGNFDKFFWQIYFA